MDRLIFFERSSTFTRDSVILHAWNPPDVGEIGKTFIFRFAKIYFFFPIFTYL